MKFETLAIRLQALEEAVRPHSTSLYPTSSFVFDDAEQMRAMFADEQPGNIYSRFTNPNVQEFEIKMAALEGTEDAVATASGMAAIFASCMALLKSGDHVIASKAIFGSTYTMFSQFFPQWGIEVTMVDPGDPTTWLSAMRPATKMFFIETPSNPGLDIIDLTIAGDFCREHRLLLQVDNCFATPYLQQPAKFGADLISHSATKYIDGQGRVLGGVVCGSADVIGQIRKLCRSTGPSLSPFNAWILSKSLETLAVRMDRHCQNSELISAFLDTHLQTQHVRYPFSKNHPGYEIAKKQMSQGGGIVTFEVVGGIEQGKKFLDALHMISLTANLGDTRTIATHPASTTHARLSPDARKEAGISDGLIRISVGLEHHEDIIRDLDLALHASAVV